jgi:hypothetical protein
MRFGTLLIAAFAVLAGLAEGNPAAAETRNSCTGG